MRRYVDRGRALKMASLKTWMVVIEAGSIY
jgi:hypothetical protein